jgi:integrase
MKLTKQSLNNLVLPAGKSEAIFFDDDLPGLGIRLRAGGSANWVFQYRLGTKQRRVTLGKQLSPARAREMASELHAKVRLGQDPAGEKEEGRARASQTFEAVVKAYLEAQKTRLRPGSYLEVERHLLTYAKALHGLQLGKVERGNIARVLSELVVASGAVSANRARATLSAMFAWAIRQGLVNTNPVTGTERQEETSRDRVLSDDELRTIWRAIDDDSHYSAILKLLLLTGQRADEIASLRWSEIVGDSIVLPPARTKNDREHIIPLPRDAAAIIEAQHRRVGRDLIFGFGEGGFSAWSRCKERLDERIATMRKAEGKADVPRWTTHDLRRTCATRMADLGVAPHVVEGVLNHVSGHKAGVAGIYNRASYAAEKTAALTLWADHVRTVVEGGERKVITLRKA